ncbi:GntR family transcriptional regulator [Pseudodonghicola sp.]|uniref:GntR family transcriptional regulator n=1 Tax=Pseudodonghicola sp. TaxID=1969463 RepID=UPI003A979A80
MTDEAGPQIEATAPSEPTAIAQWVADVLRDRIVKGSYPPGARLVERKISAELEVSRTPVREAIKLLDADGLIGISRNKGAQVLQLGPEEARKIFDVIAVLESLAAERFAEALAPEQLETLEELHDRMMVFHKIGSHMDYFDTNSEIHDFIMENCGNPIVIETHKRLMARARRGRFLAIMRPERLIEAVAEHEALMAALRQGDAAVVAQIWRAHLLHTGETLAMLLAQSEPA